MASSVFLTCLALLLATVAPAQSNPPTEAEQSGTGVQIQSQAGSASSTQKDSDKDQNGQTIKDGSSRGGRTHVRLGTVSVAGGYARFAGPLWFSPFWPYAYYPYSFAYAPFFYDPFYWPFYGPYAGGFAYAPDKGEVKLGAKPKNAAVFIDGAYAGTVDHLKNIWLDSGAYNLSISAPGHETFEKRIYVLSGKSLKIEAALGPERSKSQMEEKP
jgi:PEGA domain